MDPLLGLTMRQASDAIRSRQVSPVALVEAYLARIAAVDDQLGSYILVVAEAARAAAHAAEREIAAGHWRGPLHGLPFGVKDNYFTKGVRTCVNSRVLLDHVPTFDATVVTRLAEAGAVLLGKLNTWEFGTTMGPVYHDLLYPHPRNPWHLERFTGGSSTGAGAAVPARTALFAMGTDTGGSVRLPAAACGTQGLKTTAGLVSRHGIHPNCWALDVAGPLCWNVWDCAAILLDPGATRALRRDRRDRESHDGRRSPYEKRIRRAGVGFLHAGQGGVPAALTAPGFQLKSCGSRLRTSCDSATASTSAPP